MPEPTLLVVLVVIVALAFDYINGFHDTANAIATVVSTRVLSPLVAIVLAASLNFAGAMVATEVATIPYLPGSNSSPHNVWDAELVLVATSVCRDAVAPRSPAWRPSTPARPDAVIASGKTKMQNRRCMPPERGSGWPHSVHPPQRALMGPKA